MITREQLKILGVFRRSLFVNLTFVELKRQLKESSNSKLQRAISNFKKEEIIIVKKIGKTNLISLNYNNNKLFDYFSIFNMEFLGKNTPLDILYDIQNNLLKETEFFSLIVFGSYAEGKDSKKSDLDVAVIVENEEIRRKIVPRMKSIGRRALQEIDWHIFTREEFLEMLKDEKENLGKEIFRNHLVIYGLINFYNLVLKEVKNVAVG